MTNLDSGNLELIKSNNQEYRELGNPLFFAGGIIQNPYSQIGAQFECFFLHVFPGAQAYADEAFVSLHHQVYLIGPGPLLVLGYHNGRRRRSPAAQIDTDNGYIGWFGQVLPATNLQAQKAVIFHISLPGQINQGALVGEDQEHPKNQRN